MSEYPRWRIVAESVSISARYYYGVRNSDQRRGLYASQENIVWFHTEEEALSQALLFVAEHPQHIGKLRVEKT